MSKEGKHHYIPVFYLKQWCGPDGKLCEFQNPHHAVRARQIHPSGTGYVHGLYSIEGVPPDTAQYLETHFFKVADDGAARALRILLDEKPWVFTNAERSAWARFIVSLILRNPETLERQKSAALATFQKALPEIEADYAHRRSNDDPPTYIDYVSARADNPAGKAGAILVQKLIDDPQIGNAIVGMRWMVLREPKPSYKLLTSDRPVLITNGISYESSQIILPISPYHVFVATNNESTESLIKKIAEAKDLIPQVNDRICRQSRKFVYGFDESQFRFISKRIGLKLVADPLEDLPKAY